MTASVSEFKEAVHDIEDKETAQHQHQLPDEEQELVPLILNQESGQALMQRTVVKLIEHAGFEGSQTSALAVLSDVATNYFMSLGKTLRVYWDGYCNNMTDEEILTHTLYDNGIEAFQELEEYISDDIEKYGHRLNDIHRKLTSSYNELVNGSTDVQLPDDSFFQSEDAFINGALGEDIGEDFFGFKDLGLDKELNLERINVSAYVQKQVYQYPFLNSMPLCRSHPDYGMEKTRPKIMLLVLNPMSLFWSFHHRQHSFELETQMA